MTDQDRNLTAAERTAAASFRNELSIGKDIVDPLTQTAVEQLPDRDDLKAGQPGQQR